MTKDDLMVIEDIAPILHLEKATIRGNKWKQRTGCPLFRQGKRLFAYRAEFDKWYKSRMTYA